MTIDQQEMFDDAIESTPESLSQKKQRRQIRSRINETTDKLHNLLQGQAEEVTKKAIEKALNGDSTAIRTVLERIMPPRKDAPINIKLPHIKNIKDVVEATSTVLSAVANGKLTPNEGKALNSLIDDVRQGLELDLEERLLKIEEKISILKDKEKKNA